MGAPLEFYFDFASPYGYLASVDLERLASRHGRGVIWRPILLGAVFKITGVKPNLHHPLRGEYLLRDTVRFARLRGIPFTTPSSMPMSALAASRAFYWLDTLDALDAAGEGSGGGGGGDGGGSGRAVTLARAVFHSHFVEGRDLGPREAVAALAATCLGLDQRAVLAGIDQPEVKDRLRQETDRAIERGVFGSPFVFADGEPFWGADRLDQVDRWLDSGGW